MNICTKFQKKVIDLEDELKSTKTTQQTKIEGLERRVKKLEKKKRSRTYKLKRLYKFCLTARVISSFDDGVLDKEDASKQKRINEIDDDEDIALVSTYDDVNDDEGIEVEEEVVVKIVTTAKMIIDYVVDVAQVTTAVADIPISAAETIVTTAPTTTAKNITQAPKLRGVMIQEPDESATPKISSLQPLQVKDKSKGKAIMIEEPKVPKKRKVPERLDKEYAERLQAKMHAKIDEEERIASEKAQKKHEENKGLINTWEDIQAKIYADALLAQRWHVEEAKEEKMEEDKEFTELRQCLEIIPDDGDDVTIDATPLSSSKLLKNFDREDLEVLWRIVKEIVEKTQLVDYMDNFILHTLKSMFEHHVEDNSIQMFLLVEKMYPLTNYTLQQMFNDDNIKFRGGLLGYKDLMVLIMIKAAQKTKFKLLLLMVIKDKRLSVSAASAKSYCCQFKLKLLVKVTTA
uniref:Uncharacterized protein n=1 Tax=Tanacetum cinerariifolium TaxID=118510 RepID=A0A6L2M8X3_TANCI|nr:hypothetical protein [Tanacetum cinerariifolium]